MGVVDLFEVVEVDEEQAEAGLGDGCGQLDLLVQQGVEVACVEEAGAVVGDGELVDELDGAGVLDGDGGVVAEDAQEGDGVLALQVELGVEELDDAEGFVAGTDGDAGDGADFEFRMGAREGAPLDVEGDVWDDQGIACGGDPSGDSLAHGHMQALEALGVLADGDGVVEMLGLLVDHEHGPALWAEELGHFIHDDEQDIFELEGLGEGARDLVKDAEMVQLAAIDDLELALLSQPIPRYSRK